MKRKIIKQGHNTFTITLPSSWTKKFNLSPGDEIDLLEKENGLFLTTAANHSGSKRAEFDISNMDVPLIWKYFMATYRNGYDELLVHFTPKNDFDHPYKYLTIHAMDKRFGRDIAKESVLEALHSIVNRFIGMEIVEHGKNHVLIKDMGELTNKEFDSSMRRIFLIVVQMAAETLEAVKTNKPDIIQHIHDVDITLDKFHDYCIRILNKAGCAGDKKMRLIFSTLYQLELIGDEFKNIGNHLTHDCKGSKMTNSLPLMEIVKKQVDLYYELFYKFDEEKMKELSELDKKAHALCPILYKKASEDEKEVNHHIRIIGRFLNGLLERRIEMEYAYD